MRRNLEIELRCEASPARVTVEYRFGIIDVKASEAAGCGLVGTARMYAMVRWSAVGLVSVDAGDEFVEAICRAVSYARDLNDGMQTIDEMLVALRRRGATVEER